MGWGRARSSSPHAAVQPATVLRVQEAKVVAPCSNHSQYVLSFRHRARPHGGAARRRRPAPTTPPAPAKVRTCWRSRCRRGHCESSCSAAPRRRRSSAPGGRAPPARHRRTRAATTGRRRGGVGVGARAIANRQQLRRTRRPVGVAQAHDHRPPGARKRLTMLAMDRGLRRSCKAMCAGSSPECGGKEDGIRQRWQHRRRSKRRGWLLASRLDRAPEIRRFYLRQALDRERQPPPDRAGSTATPCAPSARRRATRRPRPAPQARRSSHTTVSAPIARASAGQHLGRCATKLQQATAPCTQLRIQIGQRGGEEGAPMRPATHEAPARGCVFGRVVAVHRQQPSGRRAGRVQVPGCQPGAGRYETNRPTRRYSSAHTRNMPRRRSIKRHRPLSCARAGSAPSNSAWQRISASDVLKAGYAANQYANQSSPRR